MPFNCCRTMYNLWLLCIWVVSMGNTMMSETMPHLQGNSNPLRVRIVNYWPWLKTRWGKVLNKGRSKFLWESRRETKSDLRIRAEPNKEGHTEWSERQTDKCKTTRALTHPPSLDHQPREPPLPHSTLFLTCNLSDLSKYKSDHPHAPA